MAFCNACGATLDGGAKFCTKCGATQPGGKVSSATPSSAPAAAPLTTAPKNNNALKIILIVVAVIVGLGIIGIATVSFIGYRFAHRSPATAGFTIATAMCVWKRLLAPCKAPPIRTKPRAIWASIRIPERP